MNMTHEDDTDCLLERARDGDSTAADELFARHRPRLRKMLQVRLDKRLVARVDPSDVIQDTMADAAKRLERFIEERPLPFYAWLRQMAAEKLVQIHRHHLNTQRRSVNREVSGPIGDESQNELIRFIASRSGTPSELIQQREQQRVMQHAVEQLAVLDREVLVLRYVEQLSAKEAAAVLGITPNTFSQRHLRALKRLKSVMTDFQMEDSADE